MIRRVGQALMLVLAILIIGAEVQRAEEAELAQHLAQQLAK